MTPQDEETLKKHKQIYTAKKKIYECAAYILSNLDTDRDWQAALKCYQYYKEGLRKKDEQLDGLLRDAVRVFVLKASTDSLGLVA